MGIVLTEENSFCLNAQKTFAPIHYPGDPAGPWLDSAQAVEKTGLKFKRSEQNRKRNLENLSPSCPAALMGDGGLVSGHFNKQIRTTADLAGTSLAGDLGPHG